MVTCPMIWLNTSETNGGAKILIQEIGFKDRIKKLKIKIDIITK